MTKEIRLLCFAYTCTMQMKLQLTVLTIAYSTANSGRGRQMAPSKSSTLRGPRLHHACTSARPCRSEPCSEARLPRQARDHERHLSVVTFLFALLPRVLSSSRIHSHSNGGGLSTERKQSSAGILYLSTTLTTQILARSGRSIYTALADSPVPEYEQIWAVASLPTMLGHMMPPLDQPKQAYPLQMRLSPTTRPKRR